MCKINHPQARTLVRINRLLKFYKLTSPPMLSPCTAGEVLDGLDIVARLNTRHMQLGARVARHERKMTEIFQATAPPAPEKRKPYFWLGAEAETI